MKAPPRRCDREPRIVKFALTFFPDMRDKYRTFCGATSFHIYDIRLYDPPAGLSANDSSRLRGKKFFLEGDEIAPGIALHGRLAQQESRVICRQHGNRPGHGG